MPKQKRKQESEPKEDADILVPVPVSMDFFTPTKGFVKASEVEWAGFAKGEDIPFLPPRREIGSIIFTPEDEYELDRQRKEEALVMHARANSTHFIVKRDPQQIRIIRALSENGVRTEKLIEALFKTSLPDVAKEIERNRDKLGNPEFVKGLLAEVTQDIPPYERAIVERMVAAARDGKPLDWWKRSNPAGGYMYLVEKEAPCISTLGPDDWQRLDPEIVLDNIADMMGKVQTLELPGRTNAPMYQPPDHSKTWNILHAHPHAGNIEAFPDNTVGLIDFSDATLVDPDWNDPTSILREFEMDYRHLRYRLLPEIPGERDEKEFYLRLVGHYPSPREVKEQVVEGIPRIPLYRSPF